MSYYGYSQRMPFGKHRGRLLQDVPTGYLVWCLGECDLKPYLADAIEAELERRDGGREQQQQREYRQQSAGDSTGRSHPPADWAAVLGQVRRRLALQHHPDRGGSIERMQGINLALDAVESELVGA